MFNVQAVLGIYALANSERLSTARKAEAALLGSRMALAKKSPVPLFSFCCENLRIFRGGFCAIAKRTKRSSARYSDALLAMRVAAAQRGDMPCPRPDCPKVWAPFGGVASGHDISGAITSPTVLIATARAQFHIAGSSEITLGRLGIQAKV